MTAKPVVLVTRKLPDAVEDRLRRDYHPRLNPDDQLYSANEIVELAAGADVLVLDEVDRMYDLGFREDVDRILAACSERKDRDRVTSEGPAGG